MKSMIASLDSSSQEGVSVSTYSKKHLPKSHSSRNHSSPIEQENTSLPIAYIMPDSATLSLTCSCCSEPQAVMLKALVSQESLKRLWLCEHCGEPQIVSATLTDAVSRWLERRGLYMKRGTPLIKYSNSVDKDNTAAVNQSRLRVSHTVKLKHGTLGRTKPLSDHT